MLTAEYYVNGKGARDRPGYLHILRSDRVGRGEVFGAERHHLGLAANHQVSELLTVQAVAAGSLGLRSECGASPFGLFAQVGLFLL